MYTNKVKKSHNMGTRFGLHGQYLFIIALKYILYVFKND